MNPVDPSSAFVPGPKPGDLSPPQGLWQHPSAGPLSSIALPAAPATGCNSSASFSTVAANDNSAHGSTPIAQPSYKTGLARLDEVTGGLRGMNILAGPRESGRSTFALQLTRGVLWRTTRD
jgi:hypothetical protein